MHYRLNPSPNIGARSFGDEVIVANFMTGIYYSLLGSAAQVWDGLMAGVPLDRVVKEVAAVGDVDPLEFTEAANALVDGLVAERLIVPDESNQMIAWKAAPPESGAYQPPVLERFTDMQDLLLLDPVHDVEEMGWPHADVAQSS